MIWCVEDDAGIRDIEVYTLESIGLGARGFADGESFFEALRTELPDLVILDVMLPGMDGLAILKRLKSKASTSEMPVIMATAKGMEYDKIKGLDCGADDYLVKPFGMMEMVARVKAVLRRSRFSAKDDAVRLGGLVLEPKRHAVTLDGQPLELTRKEFELLQLFLTHAGTVYTRDRLLYDIWGQDYDGETRTVDVHIRTLRAKLGAYGDCIKTVRGVGYKLEEDK